MKIKDCLACQMDQQHVAEFITELAVEAERDSYFHAWRSMSENADGDPDATYPTAFLEHMRTHLGTTSFGEQADDEVKLLVNRIQVVYQVCNARAFGKGCSIVKEVF